MISKANAISQRVVLVICVALLLACAGVRAVNTARAMQAVRIFPDTASYVSIASQPFWSRAFFFNDKPFVVPLIYKLLNSNFTLIVVVQAIMSALSWSLLAIQLARAVRVMWLKPVAVVVILLFSLSENVIGWDTAMLSESVSLSLLALLLTCWLWLLAGWQWRKVIVLGVVTFFWTLTRDTNAWLILLVAGLTGGIAILRRSQRRYLIVSGMLLTFFLVSAISLNIGQRWVVPLENLLTRRMLTNQAYTDYFARCGMPVTPALTRMAGKWASDEYEAFSGGPDLEGFRVWLFSKGRSCYLRWLLFSEPLLTIRNPLGDIERLLTFAEREYYAPRFSPPLPTVVAWIIYPRPLALLLWWVMPLMAGIVIGARAWRFNTAWIVTLALILLAFPHAVLVWHGDADEIGRHSLQVGIQFYLGAWTAAVLAADYLFTALRQRSPMAH